MPQTKIGIPWLDSPIYTHGLVSCIVTVYNGTHMGRYVHWRISIISSNHSLTVWVILIDHDHLWYIHSAHKYVITSSFSLAELGLISGRVCRWCSSIVALSLWSGLVITWWLSANSRILWCIDSIPCSPNRPNPNLYVLKDVSSLNNSNQIQIQICNGWSSPLHDPHVGAVLL